MQLAISNQIEFFISFVLYCIRSQLLRLQQIIKRHQSYVIQRHALLVQLQISLRTLQQQPKHNKLIVMIHTHTFCLCTNFVVYNGNFAFYFCILLSLNFQFELMHEITIKVQTINFNSFSMKKIPFRTISTFIPLEIMTHFIARNHEISL